MQGDSCEHQYRACKVMHSCVTDCRCGACCSTGHTLVFFVFACCSTSLCIFCTGSCSPLRFSYCTCLLQVFCYIGNVCFPCCCCCFFLAFFLHDLEEPPPTYACVIQVLRFLYGSVPQYCSTTYTRTSDWRVISESGFVFKPIVAISLWTFSREVAEAVFVMMF